MRYHEKHTKLNIKNELIEKHKIMDNDFQQNFSSITAKSI